MPPQVTPDHRPGVKTTEGVAGEWFDSNGCPMTAHGKAFTVGDHLRAALEALDLGQTGTVRWHLTSGLELRESLMAQAPPAQQTFAFSPEQFHKLLAMVQQPPVGLVDPAATPNSPYPPG